MDKMAEEIIYSVLQAKEDIEGLTGKLLIEDPDNPENTLDRLEEIEKKLAVLAEGGGGGDSGGNITKNAITITNKDDSKSAVIKFNESDELVVIIGELETVIMNSKGDLIAAGDAAGTFTFPVPETPESETPSDEVAVNG